VTPLATLRPTAVATYGAITSGHSRGIDIAGQVSRVQLGDLKGSQMRLAGAYPVRQSRQTWMGQSLHTRCARYNAISAAPLSTLQPQIADSLAA